MEYRCRTTNALHHATICTARSRHRENFWSHLTYHNATSTGVASSPRGDCLNKATPLMLLLARTARYVVEDRDDLVIYILRSIYIGRRSWG